MHICIPDHSKRCHANWQCSYLVIGQHSGCTAMKTCIMTQQLQSRTASQTVEMIKQFNNLLDCLNSNSLYNSNPFKCA